MICASAKIKLKFVHTKVAKCIYLALKPESSLPGDRAEVSLNLRKGEIELKIKAKDAASFRAAASAYLRWIKTAHSMIETTGGFLSLPAAKEGTGIAGSDIE